MFIHDGKGSPLSEHFGGHCFSGLYTLILSQSLERDAVTFEETFNSGGVLGAT